MTDYERGYAEAVTDCRRVVETELEYPTAQNPNDGYAAMFELMKAHPRIAVATAVALTKKSLLMRMPRGPKP